MTETKAQLGIEVTQNGPYHVTGGVPLRRVRKLPGDKKGSFSGWNVYEEIDAGDEYWLCRCGRSDNKPFCTGMHERFSFDGTENAPITTYDERKQVLGGTKIEVHDDRGICAHAAYCSNAMTNVWKAAPKTDEDEALRQTVIEMIGNCPSGALTYTLDGVPGEPPLVQEILVQADGPYLVRGSIPVRRADGQPIEIRNRMTVCRCGASKNKPLCDGTHAEIGFTDG